MQIKSSSVQFSLITDWDVQSWVNKPAGPAGPREPSIPGSPCKPGPPGSPLAPFGGSVTDSPDKARTETSVNRWRQHQIHPLNSTVRLTLYSAKAIIVPHRITWSWYTGRW